MKNLKKIVAAFAAATMVMSIASVAFADVSANIEPLEGNVGVSLENYNDYVDSTYQWTVIIIPKAKQNEPNLTANDLLYINQGNSADDFWTNMGTKGESLADGNYIMRIGSNSSDWTVQDFDFTISTSSGGETRAYLYGDVDDSGEVDVDDAMEILYYYSFMESVFDDYMDDVESWIWVAGDVDGSEEVDVDDAMEILYYYSFMDSVFDEMESESFEM